MTFNYIHKTVRPRDARRIIITRKGYGENWPRQRAAALKRDKYTCVKCGHVGYKKSNGRWTVSCHHVRKIAWYVDSATGEVDYEAANSLDNLITLCEINGCHKAADGHSNRKGFIPLK